MPQQLSTDGRYLLLPGPGRHARGVHADRRRAGVDRGPRQEVAGDRATVFVQGFQSGWHDPRLYVWMDNGAVAVLG